MAKPKIAIIGLGLIGKSIGKALRAVGGQIDVIGHDREPMIAREAQKVQAVDRVHWNLISACEGADIVIIATPLAGVRNTLEAIGSELKANCLVMDTAPLKAPVLEWADRYLPPNVNFVGGHPILNSHAAAVPSSSGDGSRADLFHNTLFCLVPSTQAAPEGIHLATDVVRLLQAKPFFIDPTEHDGLVAGVDGLPLVLALTLVHAMSQESSWREMRKLAGPAFENAAHVLSQDLVGLRDVILLNSENIVRLVESWVEALYGLRELLHNGDEKGLQQIMEAAVTVHQTWLHDRGIGLWEQPSAPEIPTGGGILGRLLGLGKK